VKFKTNYHSRRENVYDNLLLTTSISEDILHRRVPNLSIDTYPNTHTSMKHTPHILRSYTHTAIQLYSAQPHSSKHTNPLTRTHVHTHKCTYIHTMYIHTPCKMRTHLCCISPSVLCIGARAAPASLPLRPRMRDPITRRRSCALRDLFSIDPLSGAGRGSDSFRTPLEDDTRDRAYLAVVSLLWSAYVYLVRAHRPRSTALIMPSSRGAGMPWPCS
jgi:hypothetical protein